jgi:predicted nucleotidyltransferase
MEEPEEYLSHMNNDLVKLIGYKIDLVEKKDLEGISLWDELDQRMYEKDDLSEEKIVEVLNEVPISFLISFLGYAAYKERQWL